MHFRLFIPAFWWHQVTSTEQAISVNIFWGDAGVNSYLSKVMVNSFCFTAVVTYLQI